MAPINDETVEGLKNVIGNLEARVIELEQRLVHGGNSSKPNSSSESMRMILMGPPGAGMLLPPRNLFDMCHRLTNFYH